MLNTCEGLTTCRAQLEGAAGGNHVGGTILGNCQDTLPQQHATQPEDPPLTTRRLVTSFKPPVA